MEWIAGWTLVVLAALMSSALARRLAGSSLMRRRDIQRSWNRDRDISRAGGLAILCTIATTTILARLLSLTFVPFRFVGAGVAIAVVSTLDDLFELLPQTRLFVHVLAATAVVGGGMLIEGHVWPGEAIQFRGWIAMPVSLVFVVWCINMYNFIDGIDGLAAGVGLVGFAAFAWVGHLMGHARFANSAAVVSAACLGFLPFNWSPAKLFLGDLGSTLLGYLVGAFALWALRDRVMPFWLALTIFCPLFYDASSTLLRRLCQGHSVLKPHEDHLYQRSVRLGYTHRQVTAAFMFMTATSSLLARFVMDSNVRLQWLLFATIWGSCLMLDLYVGRQARLRQVATAKPKAH